MKNCWHEDFLVVEKNASEKARAFTKNLMDVLSLNGKKISEKDMDYVYKNVYFAELISN